jgi:hypothetical protein
VDTEETMELNPNGRGVRVRSTTALAKWRASTAVKLLTEGKTYDQIADEVGYANRGTAHRVVAKALAEHTVENIEELRRREGDRLEQLLSAFWAAALDGDVAAARAVLKVVDAECRLYGLYDVAPVWSPMALVMSREEAEAYELGRRDGRAEADALAAQATQGRQRDDLESRHH